VMYRKLVPLSTVVDLATVLHAYGYLMAAASSLGAEQTLCRAFHSVVCFSRVETLAYANVSFAGGDKLYTAFFAVKSLGGGISPFDNSKCLTSILTFSVTIRYRRAARRNHVICGSHVQKELAGESISAGRHQTKVLDLRLRKRLLRRRKTLPTVPSQPSVVRCRRSRPRRICAPS